jgi:predicted transposase YbfD/YdcC
MLLDVEQNIVLFNAMHCLPDLPTFCQQTVQHPVAEDGPARYESHFSP